MKIPCKDNQFKLYKDGTLCNINDHYPDVKLQILVRTQNTDVFFNVLGYGLLLKPCQWKFVVTEIDVPEMVTLFLILKNRIVYIKLNKNKYVIIYGIFS